MNAILAIFRNSQMIVNATEYGYPAYEQKCGSANTTTKNAIEMPVLHMDNIYHSLIARDHTPKSWMEISQIVDLAASLQDKHFMEIRNGKSF